jgi:ATP-dependent DNA helicase RecQ
MTTIVQNRLLLPALGLKGTQVTALPPEVREQILEYLRLWGEPAELIEVVSLLREAHGPLLSLADLQAEALYRAGNFEAALEVNERRQRRSATIASQAQEARLLLAMGRTSHAKAVADDISDAYSRNIVALTAAAEVYTATSDFPRAQSILDHYLASHTNDAAALVTAARLALQASLQEIADEYAQRLGSGISPDMDDETLFAVSTLHSHMGNSESAKAAELEIEKRRLLQLQKLRQVLSPILSLEETLDTDPDKFYRLLSGPQSIDLSRDETRRIQLEAVRHFGFMKLREGQAETIAAVLRGDSILAVMPTGAGKSLCYQLPALILPKATLIISPLIALMKDQVESLPAAARRQATFINSTLSESEIEERFQGVARGEYKLIYAAPERLRQRSFLRALRHAGLALFVVDEAHCVSLWGHDFRPDYLFIQEARSELGNPPALAMTATAPPRVRDEIISYISNDSIASDATPDYRSQQASMPRPQVMTLDIFRSSLHLSALHFHNEEEKLQALLKYVQEADGSGIIYVNSRHKCESLAFALRDNGVSAEAYHAGREDRGAIQDRFMGNKTRVVVATIAFGMGIDKSDIRFIVHFHPSRSLAAYYQEVGRAGRDGKLSQGILFYSNNDWSNLRRWAKADEYSLEFLEKVYSAVAAQLGVTLSDDGSFTPDDVSQSPESIAGAVDGRRLQQILNADETSVRVAVSMLERCDLLSRSFDIAQEVTLNLPRRLPPAAKSDPEFARLLSGLALPPGESAAFKTQDLASFMGWHPTEVESALQDWQHAGYFSVRASRRAMAIELPPRPANLRERLERMLAQAASVAQRRIDDMIGYATTEGCRHGYISAHFGSPPRTHCVVCDNCTGIRPDIPTFAHELMAIPDDADIEPMIIDCLISLPRPVGRGGLARILTGSLRAPVSPDKARHHGRLKALGEATILSYIDDLLEGNRLRQYERQGYPVLAPTLRGRAEAESWLREHPDLAEVGIAAIQESEDEELPAKEEKYTALQKAIWLWRRRLAEELKQPPYMIMSNELLIRIAEARPHTIGELSQLPGMGSQRLEHYGPTILDLIRLNPPQPGDEDLLAAQRAAQLEAAETPPTHSKSLQVSAQLERAIFLKLQELRQKKAVRERSKPYLVASNSLLKAIAQSAPASSAELMAIPGFATSALREEMEQILTFIAAARQNYA